MGNVVFWICFWLLIIVLVYSSYQRRRRAHESRRNNLRDSFGDFKSDGGGSDRFDSRPMLFETVTKESPDDFVIDDITANDLAFRKIYSAMNRCVTSAGEDYLFCRFMTMPKDDREPAGFYEDVCAALDDKDKAVSFLFALDLYTKHRKRDDLRILSSIRDAGHMSVGADIACIIFLICAVILTGIYPIIGLVMLIASIVTCIAVYFAQKRKMDDHLSALALCLNMTRVSDALIKAGCTRFEKYKDLSYLRRGSSVISYKDGTSSNPLDILFDYLRMISHADLFVYKIKIGRIKQRADDFTALYKEIGRLDAALSVASYLAKRKHTKAQFITDDRIAARQLYHPLLSDPVYNDIDTAKSVLVTGSNASGKSTFLKAVGINAIFARSFGFAFADSFETGVSFVYSSMALADDITGAKSYYVVEAESIKRITDKVNLVSGNHLVLIDEVLRGTNTVERIAASTAILKYLCRDNVLCFAATHDLELTALLADHMDMYYFSEEIHGDNVTFPFIIRKGVSDRTNAISLLAMLGFDEGVVASARELTQHYKSMGNWTS